MKARDEGHLEKGPLAGRAAFRRRAHGLLIVEEALGECGLTLGVCGASKPAVLRTLVLRLHLLSGGRCPSQPAAVLGLAPDSGVGNSRTRVLHKPVGARPGSDLSQAAVPPRC